MWARLGVAALLIWSAAGEVMAQMAPPAGDPNAGLTWRAASPGGDGAVMPAAAMSPAAAGSPAMAPPALPSGMANYATPPAAEPPRRSVVRVTTGNGTLPNEQGQVWREYDISPYTTRVTTTKRPEQAIVDWILRDTGYEAWHSEPLGILSAGPRVLRVYHTPQMQAVVADIVERFVASEAETRTFSLRVVTLDNPNWRAQAQRVLRPVAAQTPGVNAWLLAKEDAAVLLADLQRRSDYREHSSPHLLVNNGQATVVTNLRGRQYIRDVRPRADAWQGFENIAGQIDEGFSMEFSPLLATDRRTIDATLKCEINQIERMVPVMLEVPTPTSPRQRARIDVPQLVHFRFHERFRWPIDQVLLVGMGMVALPVPVTGGSTVAGLSLPFLDSPARADLLVIVESKGPVSQTPGAAAAAIPGRDANGNVRR